MNSENTPAAAEQEGSATLLRPLPHALADLGLPEIFLANLVLKHCFHLDVFTVGDLVERLKVSATIVTHLMGYLKREKYLEIRAQDAPSSLSLAHRHALTEQGKRRAGQLLEYDAYMGPTPVTLTEYWQQVRKQSIISAEVTPALVQQAFRDLVMAPEMLEQLGIAVVSGKPLFLYGPPGNGKTNIALRLGRVWRDAILVPSAIYVAGNVIRVFDEINHKPVEATPGWERCDRRWTLCRRPAIVVGGELTLEMLDLVFNPSLKYYEAPLQLKANNGMFLVDDFGRQLISPQQLLNRWIIPLENRQDFLCLHTGQKFAIPFDQFVVFATNLEPHTLVDEAFLRRIRSKVKVDYVTREQFVEILRRCCEKYGFSFDPQVVEYLLTRYYDSSQRPMVACQPRDLLEQILDYARYHQLPPRLTPENLDRACHEYFIS